MKYLKNVATLRIHAEKCTGCGQCVEVCPRAVLKMEGKKAAVIDLDRCMECGACRRNCPFEALSVSAGVGCAAAIINSMITGGEPSCGCGSGQKGDSGCC